LRPPTLMRVATSCNGRRLFFRAHPPARFRYRDWSPPLPAPPGRSASKHRESGPKPAGRGWRSSPATMRPGARRPRGSWRASTAAIAACSPRPPVSQDSEVDVAESHRQRHGSRSRCRSDRAERARADNRADLEVRPRLGTSRAGFLVRRRRCLRMEDRVGPSGGPVVRLVGLALIRTRCPRGGNTSSPLTRAPRSAHRRAGPR